MNTQVIFKIDQGLKKQAMKKAQSEGLAFATVLKLATEAYAKGSLGVQLVVQPKLNAETRGELVKISRDVRKGKNLSPAFKTAEEMKKYLMA